MLVSLAATTCGRASASEPDVLATDGWYSGYVDGYEASPYASNSGMSTSYCDEYAAGFDEGAAALLQWQIGEALAAAEEFADAGWYAGYMDGRAGSASQVSNSDPPNYVDGYNTGYAIGKAEFEEWHSADMAAQAAGDAGWYAGFTDGYNDAPAANNSGAAPGYADAYSTGYSEGVASRQAENPV
ncbi:MAG: hypothetical protein KDA75_00640 [Planctomycetaceae bacterium]|nr:hypothetical protein [Planctomycetaceae bacterium]